MTPEEAREWLCGLEEADENDLQDFVGWKEVADALETIANLRTEYAVQVQTYSSGDQPYLTRTGGQTFSPDRANWFRGRGSARNHGKIYAPGHYRVVRRFKSTPEVAE